MHVLGRIKACVLKNGQLFTLLAGWILNIHCVDCMCAIVCMYKKGWNAREEYVCSMSVEYEVLKVISSEGEVLTTSKL